MRSAGPLLGEADGGGPAPLRQLLLIEKGHLFILTEALVPPRALRKGI